MIFRIYLHALNNYFMWKVSPSQHNYETYNFYTVHVSIIFSPKKKFKIINIYTCIKIYGRYTLHDEFFFSISAWNSDTLSLAWSTKQEVHGK